MANQKMSSQLLKRCKRTANQRMEKLRMEKLRMDNQLKRKPQSARLTPGDILKTFREIRGISIRSVSQASKISELAIQKIEKNQSQGSLDTFLKLCSFYEISMDDLLFWSTEEQDADVDRAKDILFKILVSAVSKRAEDKVKNSGGADQE